MLDIYNFNSYIRYIESLRKVKKMLQIQDKEECRIMYKDTDFGFWIFIGIQEDYLKFQDILLREEFFLVPRIENTHLPSEGWRFYNKRLTP